MWEERERGWGRWRESREREWVKVRGGGGREGKWEREKVRQADRRRQRR